MKSLKLSLTLLSLIVFFGCSTSNDSNGNSTTTLPVLNTTTISDITATTVTTGGSISSDGGAAVTTRGVVWSTNTNPTVNLTTKTTDGSGIGNFSSAISGLTPNTAYYVRAYASNNIGTAYGNEVTFTTINTTVTDIEGNIYQIVTICNQVWTKTNLNVSKYRNGDVIPQVTDPTTWSNLNTGAWCYYNNDSTNGTTYGKLYNWYAVNDPRGLAPMGWHIPTDTEFTTLTDCLGGEPIAGGKMKEASTIHWNSPNTAATNSSGFTGLPGGYRNNNVAGTFQLFGDAGYWWTSSGYNIVDAYYCALLFNDEKAFSPYYNKNQGKSVRCIKD